MHKYFDRETLFELIWQNADRDGIWCGGSSSVASTFSISEDEAHSTLGELCDRRLIEKIGRHSYIVTNWPERDEPGEDASD